MTIYAQKTLTWKLRKKNGMNKTKNKGASCPRSLKRAPAAQGHGEGTSGTVYVSKADALWSDG